MVMGANKSIFFSKRISSALFAGLLLSACLSGCGDSSLDVSTVSVDKDGKVESVLYEDFDKEYYDVKELSDMTESEIAAFNVGFDSPRIKLLDADVIDDETRVKLSMSYESAADYGEFNKVDFFYGTISEAQDAGYTVSKSLLNEKGDKMEESFIEDNLDRHIIITSEKTNIKAPYNIEYMTEGVALVEKKEARLSGVTRDSVQLLLSK